MPPPWFSGRIDQKLAAVNESRDYPGRPSSYRWHERAIDQTARFMLCSIPILAGLAFEFSNVVDKQNASQRGNSKPQQLACVDLPLADDRWKQRDLVGGRHVETFLDQFFSFFWRRDLGQSQRPISQPALYRCGLQ
jgi:hypothetical protein